MSDRQVRDMIVAALTAAAQGQDPPCVEHPPDRLTHDVLLAWAQRNVWVGAVLESVVDAVIEAEGTGVIMFSGTEGNRYAWDIVKAAGEDVVEEDLADLRREDLAAWDELLSAAGDAVSELLPPMGQPGGDVPPWLQRLRGAVQALDSSDHDLPN